MKYIHFKGDKQVEVANAPMPVPAQGEVLVKITRCALCGSDFKLYHKGQNVIGGHEAIGVMEQPGHPLHGKRCFIYMPVGCGGCEECRAGNEQLCQGAVLIGWNRDGGYAEYAAVPEKSLVPIPDDISDDLAPLLLDAVSTPAHGIELAEKVLPGREDVLILGAGIIGLGALIVCRDLGYKSITVSEPLLQRQKKAQKLGASIRPSGDMTKRFSLVLECSGNLKARQEAIEIVKSGGAVVLLGENDTPWCMEENKIVRRKDFYMIRSFYFTRAAMLDNADILRRNREAYQEFVDAQFSFEAFAENFTRFAAGELTKPFFKPEG